MHLAAAARRANGAGQAYDMRIKKIASAAMGSDPDHCDQDNLVGKLKSFHSFLVIDANKKAQSVHRANFGGAMKPLCRHLQALSPV